MTFEEGAEMGLVLEAELVGYFLDGESSGIKERFCTLHESLLYTRAGGHAERLFDRVSHVTRGKAHLASVPVKRMLPLAVGIHEVHETSCYLFVARHRLVVPSGQVFSRQIVQE